MLKLKRKSLFIIFISTFLFSYHQLQAEYKEVRIDEVESIRLFNHQEIPQKVLLARVSRTAQFSEDFIAALNKAVVNLPLPLTLIFFTHSLETPKTLPHSKLILQNYDALIGTDIWMRDGLKFAMVKIKGENKEEKAIIDLNRSRDIDFYLNDFAKSEDLIYIKLEGYPHAANYGGNIDVTPNNILYFGNELSLFNKEFFLEKGYEDNYVELDVNWLTVGHVDEMLTTLPYPQKLQKKNSCPFAITVVSPNRALKLLIKHHENIIASYKEVKGKDLKNLIKDLNLAKAEQNNWPNKFFWHQKYIEENVEKNLKVLRDKIVAKSPECKDIEVIRLPVLFECSGMADNPTSCSPITSNSVNMLVLQNQLIMPDPHNDVFKQDMEDSLKKFSFHPYFLDSSVYSGSLGDIHCGTNCLY